MRLAAAVQPCPPRPNSSRPIMPTATAKSSRSPAPLHHAATAVLHTAQRLHAMHPEWVVFFREVLGVDGIVARTFGSGNARAEFECTPHYARIRELLDDLRSRERDQPADRESNRVVTVRMPRSLHEALKAEAAERRVSINTLCIAKLLQALAPAGGTARADAAESPSRPKRTGGRAK